VERARLYSLDRLCYTWATAREAAPDEKIGLVVRTLTKNTRLQTEHSIDLPVGEERPHELELDIALETSPHTIDMSLSHGVRHPQYLLATNNAPGVAARLLILDSFTHSSILLLCRRHFSGVMHKTILAFCENLQASPKVLFLP